MTDELKPCPFCGSEPECIGNTCGCSNTECFAFTCMAPFDDWNTRPIEDALVKALEILGTYYPDGEKCFCGMAFGDPRYTDHSEKCKVARSALALAKGG